MPLMIQPHFQGRAERIPGRCITLPSSTTAIGIKEHATDAIEWHLAHARILWRKRGQVPRRVSIKTLHAAMTCSF